MLQTPSITYVWEDYNHFSMEFTHIKNINGSWNMSDYTWEKNTLINISMSNMNLTRENWEFRLWQIWYNQKLESIIPK